MHPGEHTDCAGVTGLVREQAYDEELLGVLRQHVLEPLARSCEYELRIHLVGRPRFSASSSRSRRVNCAVSSRWA